MQQVNYAIIAPNVFTPIASSGLITGSITAISAALQLGGWLPAATLPNGVRLLGVSPQGYSVWLDITYQTTGISSVPNTIQWQLRSSVGTHSLGIPGWSLWDNTSAYQLVSFPCGWFFSRPGSTVDATCGGIPYSPYGAQIGPQPSPPSECNMGMLVPSEIYWSMAQNGPTAGQTVKNPRSSIDLNYGTAATGPNGVPSTCGVQTGLVTAAGGGIGDPQILRQSSTFNESIIGTGNDGQPVWVDGADVPYAAFIAWGPTNGNTPKIRGQLYNATCRSGKFPMDRLKSWDGYTWANYTDQYFFGSLWVLRAGGAVGNFGWSSQ